MPKSHPPYPPEYRRQLVELVHAGRTPQELAREFEPSAQAIRNWVAQAERDRGRRFDEPSSAEREELSHLLRRSSSSESTSSTRSWGARTFVQFKTGRTRSGRVEK